MSVSIEIIAAFP